ncbi:MAG: DNA-binding protein [Planctomycetaceae bacterium]|nr:MAG: DNA-binding protein [Planctomycetaceae bacterium]
MSAELLTIDELSHILKVSRQRAYELCRTGVVPHVRLGRQIRVHPGQLQEWLANGGRSLAGGWRREPAA